MVYVLATDSSRINGELITAARALGEVTAVVVGSLPADATDALASQGATTIIRAPFTGQRVIIPAVDALSILASQTPGPIVISKSEEGNEIAGRLAARLSSGVLTDVVGINPDGTARGSIFGDKIGTTLAVGGTSPIYTLRAGVIEPQNQPAAGTLMDLALPEAGALDPTVESYTPHTPGARPALPQADVVVSGGRGVGSAEGFTELVEPLADLFGGAVGATRDAVDDDFYPAEYQVGQTGATVSPELYIALGLSGAIQHTSGMQTSKRIVVINQDEDAPIFQIADVGVVGDVNDIVPALIKEISDRREAKGLNS